MANNNLMAMVLQGLKNAGLNDNQARIMAAEIGRENSFNPDVLFGYHTDQANKKLNVGMLSWQKDRGQAVANELRKAGLLTNNGITRDQRSIDVMAKFMVNEIKSNPAYASTKNAFLNNPNVDYATGSRVLGKNYIAWRYDDPKYASGHTNRDTFYKQLGGVVPQSGTVAPATAPQMAQFTPMPIAPLLTPQLPSMVNLNPTNNASQMTQVIADNVKSNGVGSTVLDGPTGLVQADNKLEQSMFDSILGMGLDQTAEKTYVAATQAISSAYNKLRGGNIISSNPISGTIAEIFDKVDI